MHTASVSHIGVVVWPTLLALSESAHASGRDLLVAGVAGYQVMARLGQALDARIGEARVPPPRAYGSTTPSRRYQPADRCCHRLLPRASSHASTKQSTGDR